MTWRTPKTLWAGTAVAATAALCSPPAAGALESWQVTPLSPANGATYPLRTPSTGAPVFEVEMQTPQALGATDQAAIEFSREPTLGQDGTLADDKQINLGTARKRDSDPTKWWGTASVIPFLSPGTYYFQWRVLTQDRYDDGVQTCSNVAPGQTGLCTYASPVFSFTVAAPTPVPPPAPAPASSDPASRPVTDALSHRSAVSAARRYAQRRLHGTQVKVACSREDESAFICRVRYRRKGRVKRVSVTVYRDSGRVYVERR